MSVLKKIKSLLSDAFPKESEQQTPPPRTIMSPQVPYEFSQQNEKNAFDLPEGMLRLPVNSKYDTIDISNTDVSIKHWPNGATLLKVATHDEGSDIFVVDEKLSAVLDKLNQNEPVHAIVPAQGGLTMLPEETHNFILSPVKSEIQQDISLSSLTN